MKRTPYTISALILGIGAGIGLAYAEVVKDGECSHAAQARIEARGAASQLEGQLAKSEECSSFNIDLAHGTATCYKEICLEKKMETDWSCAERHGPKKWCKVEVCKKDGLDAIHQYRVREVNDVTIDGSRMDVRFDEGQVSYSFPSGEQAEAARVNFIKLWGNIGYFEGGNSK